MLIVQRRSSTRSVVWSAPVIAAASAAPVFAESATHEVELRVDEDATVGGP